MVDLTHPKYAELQMENMTNIKSTNTWVTKMLAVLPGYIYDYPAARSIPLIQNTRNWLKICDQRWVRSGYKLVIRSRYHYYKANGIEMLAPEHFEQADAFLAELEQKAQAETENEK